MYPPWSTSTGASDYVRAGTSVYVRTSASVHASAHGCPHADDTSIVLNNV
jgi:hypothetical protein